MSEGEEGGGGLIPLGRNTHAEPLIRWVMENTTIDPPCPITHPHVIISMITAE